MGRRRLGGPVFCPLLEAEMNRLVCVIEVCLLSIVVSAFWLSKSELDRARRDFQQNVYQQLEPPLK